MKQNNIKIRYTKKGAISMTNYSLCDVIKTLEQGFKKSPEGFYISFKPLPHSPVYKKGYNWHEILNLKPNAITNVLNKISCHYYSFKLYNSAKDNGKEFKGMPYLRYRDRDKNSTFYVKNYDYKFEDES